MYYLTAYLFPQLHHLTAFFISFYYLTRFQFLDAASLGSWTLPQSSKSGA